MEFIFDETLVKVGAEYIWIWVVTEPENRLILAQNITQDRHMFVAERFMSDLVKSYGKHPASTDGGTWYPMACQFLKLKHHIHSSYEKCMIERKMQYIKDRTESFDDYFPSQMEKYILNRIKKWLRLFVYMHNKEVMNA